MLSFRLAILALKKKKETAIVLTLFIMLAVMFMDQGISTNHQANVLFFQKTQEQHAAHFVVPCSANSYRSEYEQHILKQDHLEDFEKEEVIFFPSSTNDRNKLEMGALFFNMDKQRKIAPMTPLEEDLSVSTEQAIYVPIQLKSENVKLGEEYEISYKGKTWSFVVAGYFETTTYCNVSCGFYKYFIPDAKYKEMEMESGKAYLLSARFQGNEEEVRKYTDDLHTSFLNETKYAEDTQTVLQEPVSYNGLQNRSIFNLMFGIAIYFGISILICMVVSFILMNGIREDIEKSMLSIGTLQSMGYTLPQIRNSYIWEYGLLGVIGGIFGVIFSYNCIFLMKPFLTSLCGFAWTNFIHPVENMESLLIVLLLIVIICIISVRKLRGITPYEAFNRRNGNEGRYCAAMPLKKGKLPLNLHLALKNIFVHKKSNIIYGLIVAIATFATGITLVIYFNFSANPDTLLSTVGFELADIQIKTMPGCDPIELAKELEEYPEIIKTNVTSTGAYLKYNNQNVTTLVPKDSEKVEYVTPFIGDFPKTANEVMISAELSKDAGAKVGDSITFYANGAQREYLVSGLFTSTNGYVAYITSEGLHHLRPDFQYNMINVYIDSNVSADDFRNKLQTDYKVSVDNTSTSVAEQKIANLLADYGVSSVSFSIYENGVEIYSGDSSAFCISEITSMKSFASGQIKSYSETLGTIVMIVAITMMAVITCVLRITTKSEIKKNIKEYGIMKSLGYTTSDIIRQLSLKFLFATILGCMLGASLALICAPSLFQFMLSTMGVSQMAINSFPEILFGYGGLLSIILYVVAILSCQKIRKISAYDLLTE